MDSQALEGRVAAQGLPLASRHLCEAENRRRRRGRADAADVLQALLESRVDHRVGAHLVEEEEVKRQHLTAAKVGGICNLPVQHPHLLADRRRGPLGWVPQDACEPLDLAGQVYRVQDRDDAVTIEVVELKANRHALLTPLPDGPEETIQHDDPRMQTD
eukprot:CAMPEP_0177391892 /NCGR_PEP_ID=MMETSP0368-20130122/54053_1 /TAXON_ID=447022 ORGANISM="Scrippsiella hangoei-like, Strain SHHI-4" /NCGR_SAMPLE_ID=MMETSP0368 /ASSEMBLY_ACC=CAM_ASM_000363 /LENGTH=158 /DNA_ID=CAMNT_0018857825 /DNA_START=226 /DNA_END=699 /DNA_ORIENTATION=+